MKSTGAGSTWERESTWRDRGTRGAPGAYRREEGTGSVPSTCEGTGEPGTGERGAAVGQGWGRGLKK